MCHSTATSHSPATPDKAGKHATKSSPNVAMPFAEKLTSTSKVKHASINEPSPASTYGETVASSCPATPQEVGNHDPVTGLTESLRAAQIDPAIESISGSPMPIHETKAYTQMEARTSLSEVHFSPSNTSGIDNLHHAVSENSSPSSDRLNAIRNSPNWRGDGKGNSVTFVRQSTMQPDDPFVSSEGTIEATTEAGAAFSPRNDRAGVPVTNDNAQAMLPPRACIFVANLTSTQSDDQLEHHVHKAFCQFGNCYVKIRRDPSSMPFAFVQYETEAEAQQAVRKGRGIAITGRECRTEIARVNRSLYLSRVAGGQISEEEARQVLSKFGPVQDLWYASETDREMYRLPEGIWARFEYFQDCRDAQGGFRDNNVYRLEQPRLPEDMHARLRSRQNRASSTSSGFSPIQRRSPGRMLLLPGRSTRTDFASIFVGGLPATATQEELRHMFQIYGQILNIDIVHKASVNRVNTFAFIEYLSPEMAIAAVQACPRMYGSDIRVERKQSMDPFARRDTLVTAGESSLNRYPHDMAMQFQRGLVAGMTQAAQSMPAPPVYGGYSYYQPYDAAQYNQYAAPVNSFGTPAAVDNAITGSMPTQGPGQFQYGHHGQVSGQGLNNYSYAQTSPTYAEQLQQPPRQVYQWPPTNTGNDDDNASPSH